MIRKDLPNKRKTKEQEENVPFFFLFFHRFPFSPRRLQSVNDVDKYDTDYRRKTYV